MQKTPFEYFSDENMSSVRNTFGYDRTPRSEVMKKLGDMWRNLSPVERRRYEDMAETIYEDVVQNDYNYWSRSPRQTRLSPHRSYHNRSQQYEKTPFEYFADENQAAARATFGYERVPRSEVMKRLGEMWRNLDLAERQRYINMA